MSSFVLNRSRIPIPKVYSHPLTRRWLVLPVLVGMIVSGCLGSTKLDNSAENRASSSAERISPGFEGIDIAYSPDQAKGKRLLLCFWDMQQRPSRNLIIALAEQKQALENKGVVVLLLHTSDIGAKELNDWIGKNKIPFVSGRITGDTQKVLYRWGVRGQPWLVLANENADIRTGGFELDQLDEKLRGLRSEESSDGQAREISARITLRLVDSDGLPVSGAKVGTNVDTRDVAVLNSNLSWSLRSKDTNTSNPMGEITLTRDRLFPPSWSADRKVGIYALHEGRRIGAICEIAKDDKRQVIELKLEAVCHVHGRLDSEGLKEVGRPLRWTNVYMSRLGDDSRILSHSSDEQRFEFSVPPGEYELYAYGSGDGTSTKVAKPKVNIKAGRSELDMGVIDLPATKLSTLVGRPAPELGPIKAWKNGSPVKLADLRGKMVLLHFGGGYPNQLDLPLLAELHEEFENAGLVIIALYNCQSMEHLEQKFAELAEEHGDAAEVPFRIAVDGGSGRMIEGIDRTVPGDTYAAYDIVRYTTTVLIDQKGRIVEKPNLYQAKNKLAAMLGVAVESELATWRQGFNKVYHLEDGLVLKRIAPPFIPERQDYYQHEESSQASHIERTPDFFTFHWDGELRKWGLGFGRGNRPLRSVLGSNLSINRNKYEGPKELLDVDVPGDWIVRKDASEEEKLKALEGILAHDIGRRIRFVKRTAKRRAIVVTGRFKYYRLPAVQDDRWIHMFCGEFNMEDAGGGGTADSVHQFLEEIGDHVNMSVVDQSEPSGKRRIPYRHHRSAYLGRVEDPGEKKAKVLQLLDNISRQTNLEFRLAQHSVEKWFVTEEGQK